MDQKIFNSILLAEYLLSLAEKKNIDLNMTKVQKFLYIAYGEFLSKKGRLISDETPKAWPFGPVFPKVHKKLDVNSIKSITDDSFKDLKEDTEVTDMFNLIIDKFSKYTAGQLSDWSHLEGGPWDLTTKQEGFKWNSHIPTEFIVNYFSNLTV